MKLVRGQNLLLRLWRETTGAMAIWAAFALPVLIGGAALSVDVSRMYNMEHELQVAADSLARAGAAELDQRSDAIERSNRAIANLVSNSQKFGVDGAGEVLAQSIRFLEDLPDNDYEIPSEEYETTDPYKARYVEIVVVPETVRAIFSKQLASSITEVTLKASSIAGTDNGICGAAPLFVCNPYEGTETSIFEAMENTDFQRRLIQLKTTASNADTYGPGNFGFLDPYGSGDNSKISDAVAMSKPPICVAKNAGVELQTGNIASLDAAFNTRFDMYEGSFKKYKSDALYAPAENVTKGYSGNGCNVDPDPDALGLPRDDCFAKGNCTNMGGRQGGGNWDFVSYMEVNHNAPKNITIAGTSYNFNYSAGVVAPPKPPTRYQVYRWEIDTGSIPGKVSYGSSSTPEEGTPQCHSAGGETTLDRRIMYAAVLNCAAIEASTGMNGTETNLPVETFVKIFITEPMGKSGENTIWGEMVGPVVNGKDSVAKDRVTVTR